MLYLQLVQNVMGSTMNLLEKYKSLLDEVRRLTKENEQLKAQLGLPTSELPSSLASAKTAITILGNESSKSNCSSDVDSSSDSFAI